MHLLLSLLFSHSAKCVIFEVNMHLNVEQTGLDLQMWITGPKLMWGQGLEHSLCSTKNDIIDIHEHLPLQVVQEIQIPRPQ